jgi:preprotein translocase subunit SecG
MSVNPQDHDDDYHAHSGHNGRGGPEGHRMGGINSMAASATLHCLTGCAIGEIAGLMIGTATGLSNAWTIAISVALAFFFGYLLSTLPLLRGGLAVGAALTVVLAADTLSIATMEVVDNLVMALIPGAMNAGLVNVLFWVGMMISLTVAFLVAYPVNRYLLQRGKGHALTHQYHGAATEVRGARRLIPSFPTSALVAVLMAFMLGGLIVSIADETGSNQGSTDGHASAASKEPRT